MPWHVSIGYPFGLLTNNVSYQMETLLLRRSCATSFHIVTTLRTSFGWNVERPYAFQHTPSILLHHRGPPENHLPPSILVHSASLFHFDIQDLSRSVADSNSPDNAFRPVRFPTVPAFYDAIIDTVHGSPSPFTHRRLYNHLLICQGDLTLHTVSDKGVCTTKTGELISACVRVLEEVKEENRPYLKRHFLWERTTTFEDGAMERILIKMGRMRRMGQEYTPRAIPYDPFFQRLGRPTPNPSPELLGRFSALGGSLTRLLPIGGLTN